MSAADAFTSALDAMSGKAQRKAMERDEEVATLFDDAEEEDRRYDEERQRADDEREERLTAALNECREKGVSAESLAILAFETSSLRWALEASIKREKTWFSDGVA